MSLTLLGVTLTITVESGTNRILDEAGFAILAENGDFIVQE